MSKGTQVNTRTHLVSRLAMLVVVACFCMPSLHAQESRFSVGAQLFGQTWLPAKNKDIPGTLHQPPGVGGSLDLRYTYYFSCVKQMYMGYQVGLGFGYGYSTFTGKYSDLYSVTDYMSDQVDYSINARFRQFSQFAKVDLSFMLAFNLHGVTINVGPKIMFPFSSKTYMTITDPSISAYFPEYGIKITDEVVTGRMKDVKNRVAFGLPTVNLMLAAEVGYEWTFKSYRTIGVQAYCAGSMWGKNPRTVPDNTSTRKVKHDEHMINIAPVANDMESEPTITVNSVRNTFSRLHYLEFGVRAYYTFYVYSMFPKRDRSIPFQKGPFNRSKKNNKKGRR